MHSAQIGLIFQGRCKQKKEEIAYRQFPKLLVLACPWGMLNMSSNHCVAVKEFELSYYNRETPICYYLPIVGYSNLI